MSEPLTRFEWTEKKKSLCRDLEIAIKNHGYDLLLCMSPKLLADIAVEAMHTLSATIQRKEEEEFKKVVRDPYGHIGHHNRNDQEFPEDDSDDNET
jgi:hypothetical protein